MVAFSIKMDKFVTKKRERKESESNDQTEIKRVKLGDLSENPSDGPSQPILKSYPKSNYGGKKLMVYRTFMAGIFNYFECYVLFCLPAF